MAAIRNPIEWGMDQLKGVVLAVETASHSVQGAASTARGAPLTIRRIGPADLKDALAKGIEDFGACRSDVLFLCIIYPLAGLVLARLAFRYELLPLIFPLVSGFTLIGPVAAVGLYEMSRRREQGREPSWADAFAMVRSPSFGAIAALGLILVAIFLLWLGTAWGLYAITLGTQPPASIGAFFREVLSTGPGWVLIVAGVSIGFLFAVLVLTISVVSFPLLLDRDVGLTAAIAASVRAVAVNPGTMALWGLIVAGSLVLGSLPALLGLIFVMPVLGHATWHLYRKVVAR